MTGDDYVKRFSDYLKSYAIDISSFLLDYESDYYKFSTSYIEGLETIAVTCTAKDEEYSCTRHFSFFKDMLESIPEDVIEVATDYLYEKGLSSGNCKEGTSKNEFISIVVCNFALNYANEVRDLKFEK